MKYATYLLLALLGLLGGPAASQPAAPATGRVLSISDLHFTPVLGWPGSWPKANNTLLRTLAQRPVSDWKSIFRQDTSYHPPRTTTFSDTNYWLLEHALDGMAATCPNPAFVVITGDFVGHNLTAYPASPDSVLNDTLLVKINRFLAQEISSRYATTPVLTGLGNNDTDAGDDNLPSPAYRHLLAKAWVPLQRHADPVARDRNLRTFSRGGYYAYSLPGQPGGRKLVMLNSVLFMQDVAPGSPADTVAMGELAWLKAELSQPGTNRLWLAAHVPPGMDAYKSAKHGTATPMWREDAVAGYFAALADYERAHPGGLMAGLAGHTHMSEFRLHYPENATGPPAAPVSFQHVTPSISPSFGNNPGFQVLECKLADLSLLNSLTHTLPLSQRPSQPQWQPEYNMQTAYGVPQLNAALLGGVQQNLAGQAVYRQRYQQYYTGGGYQMITSANWGYYFCAIGATTTTGYAKCLCEFGLAGEAPDCAPTSQAARPAKVKVKVKKGKVARR